MFAGHLTWEHHSRLVRSSSAQLLASSGACPLIPATVSTIINTTFPNTVPTRYDVLGKLAPGGVLVLNSVFTSLEQLDEFLPANVKRAIAEVRVTWQDLWIVDKLIV